MQYASKRILNDFECPKVLVCCFRFCVVSDMIRYYTTDEERKIDEVLMNYGRGSSDVRHAREVFQIVSEL